MIISLLLVRLARARRYVWSPAIDVEDAAVRAALIPFGMN